MTEFWTTGIRRSGKNPEAILQRFLDLGYAISLIDKHGECLVPVTSDIASWPRYRDSAALNILLEM